MSRIYIFFELDDDASAVGAAAKASDVSSTSSTLTQKSSGESMLNVFASTNEVNTRSFQPSVEVENAVFSTVDRPVARARQTPLVGSSESLSGTVKLPQPATSTPPHSFTDNAEVSFFLAAT